MHSAALDFSRWDGSARLRLERFPDVAREIDLPGRALLSLDKDDRLVELFWPEGNATPDVVVPSVRHDAHGDRAEIWLTRDARAASVSSTDCDGLVVHVDDLDRLVGLEVPDARRRLPPKVLEPEPEVPEAQAGSEPPVRDHPSPARAGLAEHPVYTDSAVTEEFSFQASLGSWKAFIADMAHYAQVNDLELAASHRRGALWGLMGVELTFVVTGPFSAVTGFAEYARDRTRMWRDGSLAGGV